MGLCTLGLLHLGIRCWSEHHGGVTLGSWKTNLREVVIVECGDNIASSWHAMGFLL